MVFRYIAGISRKPRKPKEAAPSTAVQTAPRPNDFEAVRRVIKNRCSVRKYQEKPIDDRTLYTIMESASFAPSAGNQQPWEFILVRDAVSKEHLAEAAYNQNWLKHAPVIIVACVNMKLASALYGERGEKLYGIQGVSCALENMLLTAESLGISSCWVGMFSEPRVAAITRCPEHVRPCALIALGYGAEKPKSRIAQKPEDYIHIEEFGRTILLERIIEEKSPIKGAKSHNEYWGNS